MMRSWTKHRPVFLMAVVLLGAAAGCSHRPPAQHVQTIRIEPRVDLTAHELIGVVDFGSPSNGELGPLTTAKFVEWARQDQGLVRIVELGSKKDALRSVGRDRWDAETFRALGRQHGLRTIVVGDLTVSDVRPDIRVFASLKGGDVTATVDATLDVRLYEAATGASLWSSSGRATQSVGQVSVLSGHGFAFDAGDPEAAYGDLVESLVEQTTRDLRATWERR
ncbi:MAG: hypothetical protein ACREAA_10410 [Candidatus Polarisedimenticolia bacterium]